MPLGGGVVCSCRAWVPVGVPVVPHPPAPGQPFGVEVKPMAEAPEKWQCSVRDSRGLVAYVSIALASEDAARWAALSWLRGYARDVQAADAEALRLSFTAESAKVPPIEDFAAPDRNDNPVAALFAARGISEATRDRLLTLLKASEREWERLSEDADTEPVTVALAKDRRDCDLAEVFAALGGAG